MAKPKIKEAPRSDIIPDDKNFNKGSQQGKELIENSFRKLGAGRSILIDKNNRTVAGNKATEGFVASGGKKVLIVEADRDTLVAVKRNDLDLDTGDALGIVSADYHVVQNRECFAFFDSIVDKGEAIFQTAGALGIGERIFVTAKLPEDILVHGEPVENYLLLTSGHDGKAGSAIQVGFTSVRVVCQNTLTAALRGLQNKVTILHFGGAKTKLETAAKVMGMASKYTIGLNDIFNQMAETKITDQQLRKFIEETMRPVSQVVSKEELEEQFSPLFIKKVDQIFDFAKSHDTQVTDAAAGTVWGAYNAISGYYTWMKNYKTQEEKMQDIYYKDGGKRIEKAFQNALSLI